MPLDQTTITPSDTTEVPESARTFIGLCADHVGKSYGKRPILRGVNVRVKRGEVVGLLGPNGAGKTTCFSIMTGLIQPDMGQIYLDTYDITMVPMYKRARLGVGYLPQESSIFRGLSVEENIRSVAELFVRDKSQQDARVEQLLEEFKLTYLRRSPALSLSGGERRRVEIARALAANPQFLLLDEPLAGIDPIAVNEIRDLIFGLKERHIGVLITDHNVRETLDIVDRAYILHNGKVLMEGTPADIISSKDVRRVYLGERFTL